MTKTLTEQWKDGELPIGHYYVKRKNGMVFIDNTILQFDEMPITKLAWSDKTEEVLAPVPSYEQFIGLMDDSKELDKAYDKINLLGKKLAIATKALEEYAETETYDWIDSQVVAIQALKEMEGVK